MLECHFTWQDMAFDNYKGFGLLENGCWSRLEKILLRTSSHCCCSSERCAIVEGCILNHGAYGRNEYLDSQDAKKQHLSEAGRASRSLGVARIGTASNEGP